MTEVIENDDKQSGKAKGGRARAAKMTPEERKESAIKAAAAKKELASLPIAEYGSTETPLKIGGIEIQCYVLDDGSRVLSQRGCLLGWVCLQVLLSDLLILSVVTG